MALRFDKQKKAAEASAAEHLRDHQAEQHDSKTEGKGPLKQLTRLAEAVNRSYAERTTSTAVQEDKTLLDDMLREALAQIAVVAFIGPSGTGKSTRAIKVARKHSISYLIDDGLLIKGSRIIAGTSAKKAPSKLEAVRQALFADENRAGIIRRTLAEHRPAALMILGTSDAMLEKITRNLWLNPPAMLIRIEDVSTEEEMRQARNTRMTEGKHTIPVPSMEIKHEFSGYFADPISKLRRRWDRDRGVAPVVPDSERTVVRPTFSGLGSYSISDEAMRMMIEIILRRVRGVAGLVDFKVNKEIYGVVITLELALAYGYSAQLVLREVQERVSRQVEEYTSIYIMAVNVKARRVVHVATAQAPVQS
jgi:adenylate kinase family enzyme